MWCVYVYVCVVGGGKEGGLKEGWVGGWAEFWAPQALTSLFTHEWGRGCWL